MKFDIIKVLAAMSAAILKTIKQNSGAIKDTVDLCLQRKKDALELLFKMRENGELNQKEFEKKLQDEKLILESELCAIATISQSIAQKAAKAAITVFIDNVKKFVLP